MQLMWSSNVEISKITLRNSPFWTLHPYDCKNVTISKVTILAPPIGAPNTDGIDPGNFVKILDTWLLFPFNYVALSSTLCKLGNYMDFMTHFAN